MPDNTLVLTDGVTLPGEHLTALLGATQGLPPGLQLCTGSSPDTLKALQGGTAPTTYTRVVSLASTPALHSHSSLSTLVSLLAPGGTLTAHEAQDGSASGEELQKRLLLAGLLGAEACPSPLPGHVAASGRKSERQGGARVSLLKRKQKVPSAHAAAPAGPAAEAATWSLDVDDGEAGSAAAPPASQQEEAAPKPARAPKPCPPGAAASARKACKNCSCGRAEAEARGEPLARPPLTRAMLDNPQSACGSCGLGDKFRCAGCPYAGLPAFKMGQKIELPPDFLVADA